MKATKSLAAIAVLFGLLNTLALQLFYRNALPVWSFQTVLLFVVEVAALGLLFLLCARVILKGAETIARTNEKDSFSNTNIQLHLYERYPSGFAFALILLCWLPWLISYYPASMEWDVYDPIMRFLRLRTPNDNHPWFYCTIVGTAYKLGLNLGDKNLGIFLYMVIRAILMAAIYARCVGLQKRFGLPRWVYLLTGVFYAITPIWGAYAKHAFKDTISAALFCWLIQAMVMLVYELHQRKLQVRTCMEYSAAALGCCLFRHNAALVVLAASILIVSAAVKKKQKPGFILLLLSGFALFQCYHAYIYNVLLVERPQMKDAVSMFYQQTARTVQQHREEIREDEKAVINYYLDLDLIPEKYDPIIADPVKDLDGTGFQNLSGYIVYLNTWAEMGLRFPVSYLEAFIAQSSGYYAFTPDYTEAQRYGPGSHSNVGMTVFNWVEDSRFEADFTCHYVEKLGTVRNALDQWVKIWHRIPILNLTDSKPLYTWLLVLMAWLFVKRKERLKLIPVITCLLMVATCIFMPVNDCFRYYAPVAAAFPPLLVLIHETE